MNKLALNADAAIMALNALAVASINTVEVEGIQAVTKMSFIPRFVGIVKGQDGTIERTPNVSENFKSISSSYITVLIDKSEGSLPKLIKKAIMKNNAPRLYEKLLLAAQDQTTGDFPEFNYDGEPIQTGDLIFPRKFYIKNTNTKSGVSEDQQGNKVETSTQPFVYFPDFENIQTMIRKSARTIEYSGMFIDSKAAVAPPIPGNNNQNPQH